MQRREEEATILHDLAIAVGRHWLAVVAVLVLSVVSCYAALQFMTEQYESKARLLVKLGRENIEPPVTVEKGGVLSTGVRKEEINSEIQMLAARELVEAAIDKVGLDAFKREAPPPTTWFGRLKYEAKQTVRMLKRELEALLIALNLQKHRTDREKVVLLMQKAFSVERERDSDVILAKLRLPDPSLCVELLDTMIALYLDRHVEVRRGEPMSDFFAEQAAAHRDELARIDREKQKVLSQRGISSVPEQRALLLRRLHVLYQDIEENEKERRLLATRGAAAPVASRAPATDAVAEAPAAARPPTPALTSYPAFDVLKRRVTDLRIKRNELLQRFKPDSPSVSDIDEEIGDVELMLRRGLESLLRELRRNAADIEAELEQLNIGEKELDSLERERLVALQSFQGYSKRRDEARVSEELDLLRVSNIVVLSRPERPIEHVYPRKLLIMVIAVPFGLLLGLSLALLLEYTNDRVRDVRDLRGLPGLSLLGRLRI